jgi:ribosomal-protein-alanine N-acetyltransferase
MARSAWRRSSDCRGQVLRPPASRLVADENFVIDTARMRLIAAQLALLRTELADPSQLAALLGVEVPASWPPGEYDRDAIVYFLSQYEIRGPEAIGWYGWYAVRRAEGGSAAQLVGAGGYFGPPTAEGTVEIGYSIVDEVRGEGYGTELARALTERALRYPGVHRVIAHVAAGNVASHKVLKRAGFHFAAAVAAGKQRYERAGKAK